MSAVRSKPSSYKEAGVDIDAGNRLVERIRSLAAATHGPGVVGGIGGFSSLFQLPGGLQDPLLVSACDGVGTKLKLAFSTGLHDTVGIDLVAMNVNDLICCGAKPLFFLDYFATGKLEVETATAVVAGIAEGCRQAGCALIGGETAEMPDFYPPGEYDLAGFAVGVVERHRVIDGTRVQAGDAVIGLLASGLHSNGYSLARRVLIDEASDLHAVDPVLGRSLASELLTPTRIYVDQVSALRAAVEVRALVHVTGGGLIDNPPRSLPESLAWRLDQALWDVPAVMREIQARGGLSPDELRRTFNMGLGMLVVVPRDAADRALASAGVGARLVGEIVPRTAAAVEFVELSRDAQGQRTRLPVGVLVSGSGTNLQAILDAARSGAIDVDLRVVVSNRPRALAIERARRAGVPVRVLSHRTFDSREAFEQQLAALLVEHQVEWVVLAGFMRVLTRSFLRRFPDRVVNIHPALLPAFPGVDAQQQAADYGVKVAGCTVHFVDEGTDTGPIIAQSAVLVGDGDDAAALRRKILEQEHLLYPRVLQAIAEGRVQREGRRVQIQRAPQASPAQRQALASL